MIKTPNSVKKSTNAAKNMWQLCTKMKEEVLLVDREAKTNRLLGRSTGFQTPAPLSASNSPFVSAFLKEEPQNSKGILALRGRERRSWPRRIESAA
jgi:hypothetical protein